mmetsp:Transcript_55498/g.119377  ORF Transcript_55498/g.119377 Transcript_55498/m.119377 type:complete len:429 (-) Transcript_55498:133-1419(-)
MAGQLSACDGAGLPPSGASQPRLSTWFRVARRRGTAPEDNSSRRRPSRQSRMHRCNSEGGARSAEEQAAPSHTLLWALSGSSWRSRPSSPSRPRGPADCKAAKAAKAPPCSASGGGGGCDAGCSSSAEAKVVASPPAGAVDVASSCVAAEANSGEGGCGAADDRLKTPGGDAAAGPPPTPPQPRKVAELLAAVRAALFPEPKGIVVERTPVMSVRKRLFRGSDGVVTPQVFVTYQFPDIPAEVVYNFLRNKADGPRWHRDVAATWDVTNRLDTKARAEHLGLHSVSGASDAGRGPPGSGGTSLRAWLTQYRMPAFVRFLGLPPREILEYRVCTAAEPDAYLIAMSSTGAAEELGLAASKGYQRAHLSLSGYACIPMPSGGCEFRFLSHMNPVGVPTWILDRLAISKPKEFCEALAREVRNGYQAAQQQ